MDKQQRTTVEAPQGYSTADQYKYAVDSGTRTLKRECEARGRRLDNFQLVAWDGHTFTFTGEAVRHWRVYFNAFMRDRAARQRKANRLAALRAHRTQRWLYADGAEASNIRFGRATPLATTGVKST